MYIYFLEKLYDVADYVHKTFVPKSEEIRNQKFQQRFEPNSKRVWNKILARNRTSGKDFQSLLLHGTIPKTRDILTIFCQDVFYVLRLQVTWAGNTASTATIHFVGPKYVKTWTHSKKY